MNAYFNKLHLRLHLRTDSPSKQDSAATRFLSRINEKQHRTRPLANVMTFQCYAHADNTREYIITSDAPRINSYDFMVVLACAGCVYFLGPTFTSYTVIALLIVSRIIVKLFMVTEETILVIRDVGAQVKTVYLGGRSTSRFIDRSKISDIIINEAITMMHIRVYMAIIIEGEDKMVVVFQHLLPRLNVLLQAYHGARSIIFNEKDRSDVPLEFS